MKGRGFDPVCFTKEHWFVVMKSLVNHHREKTQIDNTTQNRQQQTCELKHLKGHTQNSLTQSYEASSEFITITTQISGSSVMHSKWYYIPIGISSQPFKKLQLAAFPWYWIQLFHNPLNFLTASVLTLYHSSVQIEVASTSNAVVMTLIASGLSGIMASQFLQAPIPVEINWLLWH